MRLTFQHSHPRRRLNQRDLGEATPYRVYTVLALGDAFLQSGLEEGCLSWDVHLSKQLSVVLIAACACRAGETARTPLYKGAEYLAYKDIVLSFGGGDQLKDLSMDVSLRAVKGFKYVFKHARIDIEYSLILRPNY